MTPREAAKDLIRPYVRHGESIESLRASSLGAVNGRYRAMIDSGDAIGVVLVGGNGVEEWVSLREVYDAVRVELDGQPVQARLFRSASDGGEPGT